MVNLFILSNSHTEIAEFMFDKHIPKIILEAVQLLSTAKHILDPTDEINNKKIYKLTHKNHPSSIWCRTSKANYEWLCQLGLELCYEYTFRYGKIHKCEPIILELSQNIPPIPDKGFTTPAQAMPDIYKDKNDPIEAYRAYYFFDKNYIHSWKGKVNSRNIPDWIIEMHTIFEK